MNDENDHAVIVSRCCCACGKEEEGGDEGYLLDKLQIEAPPGFSGWACLVCHLAPRGAMVLICKECDESGQPLEYRFVCAGAHVFSGRRMPLDERYKRIEFKHDEKRHQLFEENDPGGHRLQLLDDDAEDGQGNGEG